MQISSMINNQLSVLEVPNTYYIKEFHNTLLSAIDLTDRDYTLVMKKNHCHILDPSDHLRIVAVKDNGLFRILPHKNIVASALQVNTAMDNFTLWHHCLGHVNFDDMNKLSASGSVLDFSLTKRNLPTVCETCIQSKQTRKSLPKAANFHVT